MATRVVLRVVATTAAAIVADGFACEAPALEEEQSLLQMSGVHLPHGPTNPLAPPREDIGQVLWLAETADFGLFGYGNCSYPGLLLPDPNRPLLAYSTAESISLNTFDAVRTQVRGAFNVGLLRAATTPPPPSTSSLLLAAEKLARSLMEAQAPWAPSIQGHFNNGAYAWEGDDFAGDFVAGTWLSMFLEVSGDGEAVLDFTGRDGAGSASRSVALQHVKRRMVQTFPPGMLKCKAFFSVTSQGLALLSELWF